MDRFIEICQFYFINDGRCLIGVAISAFFWTWFVWCQVMRRDIQTPGKFWWKEPLIQVIVSFVLGVILWPLGLAALVIVFLLCAFGATPQSRPPKKPPKDDLLGPSGACVGR